MVEILLRGSVMNNYYKKCIEEFSKMSNEELDNVCNMEWGDVKFYLWQKEHWRRVGISFIDKDIDKMLELA